MIYDAITFDTQTVMQAGFRFERGILAQLEQFKGHPTQVVVSEVVVREVTSKLVSDSRAAAESFNAAERKAAEFKLLPERTASEIGALQAEAERIAKGRVATYLENIGAHTIALDGASLKDVMDLYFRAGPPFSPTGAKKNEFPDAVALLSLEAWAEAGDRRILAVSADKDWSAFAEKSRRLDVAKTLPEALETLQQHAEQAKAIIYRLASLINDNEAEYLHQRMSSELSGELERAHLTGNANSSFEAEFFMMGVELTDFNVMLPPDANGVTVVQFTRGHITAKLDVELSVEATANFSLSAYDSIDRESVPMGSATATTRAELEATILVTFEGDFETDEIEITEVSFLNITPEIDFGDIEPDWMNEAETDEE